MGSWFHQDPVLDTTITTKWRIIWALAQINPGIMWYIRPKIGSVRLLRVIYVRIFWYFYNMISIILYYTTTISIDY